MNNERLYSISDILSRYREGATVRLRQRWGREQLIGRFFALPNRQAIKT